MQNRILFLFLSRKNKREKWKSMFIFNYCDTNRVLLFTIQHSQRGVDRETGIFCQRTLYINNILQNKIGHSAKFRHKLILSTVQLLGNWRKIVDKKFFFIKFAIYSFLRFGIRRCIYYKKGRGLKCHNNILFNMGISKINLIFYKQQMFSYKFTQFSTIPIAFDNIAAATSPFYTVRSLKWGTIVSKKLNFNISLTFYTVSFSQAIKTS